MTNGISVIMQLTAKDILKTRFISYATPLELARRWLQSADPALQREALLLLEGLFEQYAHSLEIGQHLVLAYLECRQYDKVQRKLEEIEQLCRNPNEEVLSRWGRLYREQGDQFVAYPEIGRPNRSESPDDAVRCYRLSLAKYSEAYKIRSGHYPGINRVTLLLLIAAFTADAGERAMALSESEKLAKALLARRAEWPREYDDDSIWHDGTAGEANLLLKEWKEASNSYLAAREHSRHKSFHRTAMRKQAIRILHCHRRLGVTDIGPFDQLDQIFPVCEGEE